MGGSLSFQLMYSEREIAVGVSSPKVETVRVENFLAVAVGPLLRQFLTRIDDFFGGPYGLTLGDNSFGVRWPSELWGRRWL